MTAPGELGEVLREAQQLGFIGGTDLEAHVRHAEGFAAAIEARAVPATGMDLGSGGGLPGLVLAARWPSCDWWLLDASERRTSFLTGAVERLGWSGRVGILRGRAEELGHDPQWRGRMDVVTARSFGPPAVTAECGAGFLRPGGWLVVSDPPPSRSAPVAERWPAAGLAELGLEVAASAGSDSPTVQLCVLQQARPCPNRYPRRVGVPTKRPLF